MGKTVTKDLKEMSVEELDALMTLARQYRHEKATPVVLINGYVDSVKKHTDSLLMAIRKLDESEGVGQAKWDAVEAQLRRLQLDVYREEARRTPLRQRPKA